MAAELVDWQARALATPADPAPRSRRMGAPAPLWIVAALTIVGVAIRLDVANQSLFADELSTYWISATHSLGGVVSLLYGTGKITHAEITPPLYFVAAWLTTQFGHTPELLRAPALVAGAASIPLVYLVGVRTVGRRAALLAAALTALSPFMIYYSAEARAYGVMMALVLASTLAMLRALAGGRRWWVLYAVCSSAAFYTHYTSAFVLGAQFLWLVLVHPEARRPALLSNLAAAAAVLPWAPGLINDLRSPTLKILSALSPFTWHDVRLDLEHWAIGYPFTTAGRLPDLPGWTALVLLGVGAIATVVGLAVRLRGRPLRRSLARIDTRVWLVLVLALAAPVGEAAVSLFGSHIFGVRDLAVSWPYLAIASSVLVTAAGPRLGTVAAALAVVAFAFGASKMLAGRFQRPDYQAAAGFVAHAARPGDVVIDETGALSPGPLTGFDVSLHQHLRVIRAQAPAERDHPFGFLDPVVPLPAAIRAAVAEADGRRVFLVTNAFQTDISRLAARVDPAAGQFPARYRLIDLQRYSGIGGTLVGVYAEAGPQHR